MDRPNDTPYEEFLRQKVALAEDEGLEVSDEEINPLCLPHQRDIIRWMVAGGRRACFAAFGLGKSVIQLETVRLVRDYAGGRGLIVCPLGVRQEFARDALMLAAGEGPGIANEQRAGLRAWQTGRPDRRPSLRSLRFIRRTEELGGDGLYVTNYESVRDGRLDPSLFSVVSLDEAACLRGFGGTKTFREMMRVLAGDDRSGVRSGGVPYRFVATATPSPNEYIELLAYAAFLGIMDVSQAKTRFFKRDSTRADKLTLHPHKEREFWLWVASWGLFVQRPSDLGHDDTGYDLPPLEVRWHEVATDHGTAGHDRDGQARLVKDAALGVATAAREKRESLGARVSKVREILEAETEEHFVIWHDLEAERRAIEEAIPDALSVYGALPDEEKEERVLRFADGKARVLAGKPVMLGAGVNFQRHCHRAVYAGINFKFYAFVQSLHRLHRFLQSRPVEVDLIYTEAERGIRQELERKWREHEAMVDRMAELIREYGLSAAAMRGALTRGMGVERREAVGRGWRMVNDDAVRETARMESESVDLVVTSIPFATQYEYSPNYADMGHTTSNTHFWRQMDYLTPDLVRVVRPGRVVAIHTKDRITPGGINGYGFQTVEPFSDQAVGHYRGHGLAFLARVTVVTDVVRENNQTYRLGWTEQCKDGTRMGAGMPEYILLFRKPPTDRSDGYADVPVVKSKPMVVGPDGDPVPWHGTKETIVPGTGYSRGRWQLDAHGFYRSSGDRLLSTEDLESLPHEQLYKLYRREALEQVYDYARHVGLCEDLEAARRLPVTFMLLPPPSWHPHVWADVARMRTLNMIQQRKGREFHLCPLQLDIVDRLVGRLSMPGEVIYDPFAGIGTVPSRAVQLGRVGWGCELSEPYWTDAVGYCQAAEQEVATPTLFDLLETEPDEPTP